MTDSQVRRLEDKLDQLLDKTSSLEVGQAVMHEHIKAVDDSSQKVERRVSKLEEKLWPIVGGLAVATPIGGAILAYIIRS